MVVVVFGAGVGVVVVVVVVVVVLVVELVVVVLSGALVVGVVGGGVLVVVVFLSSGGVVTVEESGITIDPSVGCCPAAHEMAITANASNTHRSWDILILRIVWLIPGHRTGRLE